MDQLQRRVGELVVAPINVVLVRVLLVDRCTGVKEYRRTLKRSVRNENEAKQQQEKDIIDELLQQLDGVAGVEDRRW